MKEKEYLIYLDDNQEDRIRMIIRIDKGKVFDMVVQYESEIKNQWKPIVRYDCAHGYFHRDLIFPNGDKVKKAINIYDIGLGLTYAEQDIKDRWKHYKEHYIKLIKK